MNTLTRLAAVALLAGFTQHAAAQGSVAAELSQTVSPNIHSETDGSASQFVWVKRIEGRDRAGLLRVLFTDLEGALLPIDQLSKADRLIDVEDAHNHGRYHDLKLQLGTTVLSVNRDGMHRTPLPQGIASEMVLRGDVEVNASRISSNGLQLQAAKGAQLALLDP